MAGPLAFIVFWWLQQHDLVADTPYLLLVGLVTLSSASDAALTVWQRRRPESPARAQTRFVVTSLTTTAVLYAVGWGSLFVIGYAVGATIVLAQSPTARWRAGWACNALVILGAQVAVHLGLAPSLVDNGLSHAMAGVGLLGLALVMWILSATLEARMVAERELRRREERLAVQASTDSLTGLANRTEFTERLEAACGEHRPVVVAFVDLDDFKQVNDTFGHQVGDDVLVEVGNRLRKVVRDDDTVARLGGDEFVVLVERRDDREPQPDVLADRIRLVLGAAWPQINPLSISASVGVVVDETGTREPDDLLREADQAMYTRKRNRELARLGLAADTPIITSS